MSSPSVSIRRGRSRETAQFVGTDDVSRTTVWILRIAILVVILLGWQFVPKIPGIRNWLSFENPFFISSPSMIARELYDLATGAQGAIVIWVPLFRTVVTALIGTAAALATGSCIGLAVSSYVTFEKFSRPFVVLLNAMPRIAMIPIIVLLFGSSEVADAITAFIVVFFLVFYNAAEGGSTVPKEILQNAALMGASRRAVMWKVRWPFALAWTFAALPNAIAFGLVGTITTELFTGGAGIGYQLVIGINNTNATLIFAIVVVVSVVGVILVLSSSMLRRVLIPWWEKSS